MRLPFRKPRPGTVWDGPAAIFDDATVDHRHGVYTLTDDGKQLRKPVVRLVVVPDGDSHHYEVAAKGEGPARPAPTVNFEADNANRGEVNG